MVNDDNLSKQNPEKKVEELRKIIDEKNRELEENKKKLNEAEKQEQEKKIFEAILKRTEDLKEEFEEKEINKEDKNDLSSLLLEEDKDLESKLKGLSKDEQEISMYLSSKSPTEDLYNNIKSIYANIQNGTVTPDMAEMAGNIQYALQQKYQDIQSGDYNPEYDSGKQAVIANKIADDILSIYTGTKENTKLRKY